MEENFFRPSDLLQKYPYENIDEFDELSESLSFFIKILLDLKKENYEIKQLLKNQKNENMEIKKELQNRVSYENLYVKLKQWEDSHNLKFSANIDLFEEKLDEYKKNIHHNFKQDFGEFRKMFNDMKNRVTEMESLYQNKVSISEFDSRMNDIAFKNDELFREYYQSLKSNYDRSIQKQVNNNLDFERLIEQKVSDINRLSVIFESKIEEMNKVLLNAAIVDDIMCKVKKIENLTFSMEDMLKECHDLKNQIIDEHND